ncbi:Crp/Fnr family transcriptional regulator [Thermosynechococcus sp. B3]|uniref:Crp/Fnr family transcriptional regulator n=1 Tax=Thermosynechococcus sp. B3 TaxID=2937793 RepID=UPI002576562A|nr:Crp/Fnr family transcriptional regulator [Thermosynechococcus sp. B3]WJI29704.1 Crp/Fnr family transcriptional regulator [Thermosynechococcus sp. B3]
MMSVPLYTPIDPATTAAKAYPAFELGRNASLVLRERVWLIQTGIIEINLVDSDGNLCFIGLGTAGMAVCGSPDLCYEIQALSPSRLLSFTAAEVHASAHLPRLICEGQQYRQYYSDLLLKAGHYPTAVQRLYEVLVVLGQMIGVSTPAGVRLPVRFTHAQLSRYTGITRVTVTRLLHQLRQQQRLWWGRDRHLILLGQDSCCPKNRG